jgi:hypothetical protein
LTKNEKKKISILKNMEKIRKWLKDIPLNSNQMEEE